MYLRLSQMSGCTILVLLLAATGVHAERVATMTLRVEAAGGSGCVQGTWDDATFTVFGTPVNFGTDVGGLFCSGSHCTATPDAAKFSFDFSVVSGSLGGSHVAFVVSMATAAGTLATTIGADFYTIDGETSSMGTLPGTTIPGCPVVGPVDVYEGQSGLNAFRAAATDPGANVSVTGTPTFTDPATGTVRSADVGVTFASVTAGGSTLVTATSSVAGSYGSNFAINLGGLTPIFIDITTTATFSGPVTICQHYDDADDDGFVDGSVVAETDLHILHGEAGTFVDRTVSRDTVANVICAEVTSLSPFVIAVDLTAVTTHDTVVVPAPPVTVTIGEHKTSAVKSLKVKVRNADVLETAGHQIRLAVTASTCPASLLRDSLNQPVDFDFVGKTSGVQNPIVVIGGKTAAATLPLRAVAGVYNSPNAKSPVRCTLTVSATTVSAGTTIDPNPSNNTTTIEIDVIDKNVF